MLLENGIVSVKNPVSLRIHLRYFLHMATRVTRVCAIGDIRALSNEIIILLRGKTSLMSVSVRDTEKTLNAMLQVNNS